MEKKTIILKYDYNFKLQYLVVVLFNLVIQSNSPRYTILSLDPDITENRKAY